MTNLIIDALADQGWAVMPDFLPGKLVSLLSAEIESFHHSCKLVPAGTGQGQEREVRQDIRGDGICWLDESQATPAQLEYLDRMETLRLEINRQLQLGLFDLEVHFARYPAGSSYKRHLDVFREDARRALSVICYLNQDWHEEEGGHLRLYPEKAQPVDILPTGGTLACFISSGMPHEVLPATRPRISLTGWFRRR